MKKQYTNPLISSWEFDISTFLVSLTKVNSPKKQSDWDYDNSSATKHRIVEIDSDSPSSDDEW